MQLCTRCDRIITADTICSIADCPNAGVTKAAPPSAPSLPPKAPAKRTAAKTVGAAIKVAPATAAATKTRGATKSLCPACAADNPSAARFCRECGSPMETDIAPVYASPPVPLEDEWVQPTGIDPQVRLIAIIGGAILLLGLLAYLAFGRGDNRAELAVADNDATSAAADAAANITGQETAMWVVADANIRDRATAQGSQLLGKSPRGTQLMGVMMIGEDGKSPWFRLSDGRGFVGAVNLSQSEPPKLVKIYNDQLWYAPDTVSLHALPDSSSAQVATLTPGQQVKLTGITDNGFAEAKLNRGGVGYIAPGSYDFSSAASSGADIGAFYAMLGMQNGSVAFFYNGTASDQSITLSIWSPYTSDAHGRISYFNTGTQRTCDSAIRLVGRDEKGRFRFAQSPDTEGTRCGMFPTVTLSGDSAMLNAWWKQNGQTLMSAKLQGG